MKIRTPKEKTPTLSNRPAKVRRAEIRPAKSHREKGESGLDTASVNRGTWQAKKSDAMRRKILDTTLECFSTDGYLQTTTLLVAKRANVSRGAIGHHFPSIASLVEGAIEHLHGKRLRAFRNAFLTIGPTGDRIRLGLEAYWKQIQHPLFFVFLELKITSRTNLQLARIFHPATDAFTEQFYKTAEEVFPEWGADPRALRTALDLLQYTLEGIALNMPNSSSYEHIEGVMKYLEGRLRELRPASI